MGTTDATLAAGRRLGLLAALLGLAGLGALGLSGCSDDDPVAETTPPGPPAVTTEPASVVDATTARLNARVFPNGAATTIYFDLGSDVSYGARTDSVEIAAGWDTVAVHVDVSNLMPTTGYHCRAAAFNAVDTAHGDDESFTTLTVNAPPETQVTATYPNLSQTPYDIAFFWAGLDPDGEVTRYEWRISDNGVDGAIDVGDTLGLDWHSTTVTDSIFIVTADLPAFPADPDLFWQTHTFFIRAVDDREYRDPTPDSVSFTATTKPPEIRIFSHGGVSTTCVDVSENTEVLWAGTDADASDGFPSHVRWILLEQSPPGGGNCWSKDEFEVADPFSGVDDHDPGWSDWLPYAQAQSVSLPSRPLGAAPLLGLQAQDEAGARTLQYDWNVNTLALRYAAPDEIPCADTSGGAPAQILAEMGEPRRFSAAAVVGQFAYLCSSDGLLTVDVSDVLNPTVVGAVPGCDRPIVVRGSRLYVGHVVDIYDVSEPAHPRLLGQVPSTGSFLTVVEDHVYKWRAGDREPGWIDVYDCTDPAKPRLTASNQWGDVLAVAHYGQRLYVSLYSEVRIIDVSDPAHPDGLGYAGTMQGADVEVLGDFLIWWGSSNRLIVASLADPDRPEVVAQVPVGESHERFFLAGNHAYVCKWEPNYKCRDFTVVDLTDPTDPIITGSIQFPGLNLGVLEAARGAVLYGSAYESDGLGLLVVAPPCPRP